MILINYSVSKLEFLKTAISANGLVKEFKDIDPTFPFHKLYFWVFHNGIKDANDTYHFENGWDDGAGNTIYAVDKYGLKAHVEFIRDNKETLRLESSQATVDGIPGYSVNMFPWSGQFTLAADSLALEIEGMWFGPPKDADGNFQAGTITSILLMPRLINAEIDRLCIVLDKIYPQYYDWKTGVTRHNDQLNSPPLARVYFQMLSSKTPW